MSTIMNQRDNTNQTMGSQANVHDDESDQDFAQAQITIATKALNTLADEYLACVEILEDTLPTRLGSGSEDAVVLRMRMASIERFFRSIGSDIRRYAEV